MHDFGPFTPAQTKAIDLGIKLVIEMRDVAGVAAFARVVDTFERWVFEALERITNRVEDPELWVAFLRLKDAANHRDPLRFMRALGQYVTRYDATFDPYYDWLEPVRKVLFEEKH
jgi:hypothetical protein